MTPQPKKSKVLPVALWIAQALLAALYVGTGLFKLVTPVATLAGLWPWAGEYPALVRATGIIDLAGGLGLVLPALTRRRPGLMVLSAAGCALLQVGAIVFHVARGEGANTPFNFAVLALTLFVLWGRRAKAPVQPNGQ